MNTKFNEQDILSKENIERITEHLQLCGWRETTISVKRKIQSALARGDNMFYGLDYNGNQVAYTFA